MKRDDSRDAEPTERVRPAQGRYVILHVLPQDLNRGAQVYAGRLRDTLCSDNEQDHRVVTLFDSAVGGARPDIELGVRSSKTRAILDLRAVWRLRRTVRASDAAVVVAHGGEALKYVIAAGGPRPSVYYRVGLSTAEIMRPLHRALYRFLSNRASLVVGNSSAILDQVRAIFGIPGGRLALIPNGRDPSVFYPRMQGEAAVDPPRLLFVGQLEPGKRPGLFIEVVSLLKQRGYDFEAVVVGDGPLRDSLQRRGDSLGVRFLGVQADVAQLFRDSTVVVLTSAPGTEGMPGVLIEAGLSGIPAVATAAAGVSDVIVDGITGWVVQGGAEELAARAGELLDDSALRLSQGMKAREWCLTRFSLDATAGLWRELVARLISDARSGGGRGPRNGAG